MLVNEQQEKPAGEDDEYDTAEPVLLWTRHVFREGRNVGDVHLPPAEGLIRQPDGDPHAPEGHGHMAEPGKVIAEPGRALRHCASFLCDSRTANGQEQNAGEKDSHVATLPSKRPTNGVLKRTAPLRPHPSSTAVSKRCV